MRVTTLETMAARVIQESLGAVRGSALWPRRIVKRRTVGLRALEHGSADQVAGGQAFGHAVAGGKMNESAGGGVSGFSLSFAPPANDTGAVIVPFARRKPTAD